MPLRLGDRVAQALQTARAAGRTVLAFCLRPRWLGRPLPTPTDIPIVAAAVARTDDGWLHSGLFFRTSDDPLQLLHLAFHRDLQLEAIVAAQDYSWVLPIELHPIKARMVAAACKLIWDRNWREQRIPWSLDSEGCHFDRTTGVFVLGRGGGLSCSTFIAEVLRYAAIQLVDPSTWPKRKSDRDNLDRICVPLGRRDLQQAHYVRRTSLRFRLWPAEVAGAFRAPVRPTDFDFCSARAREIHRGLAIPPIGP